MAFLFFLLFSSYSSLLFTCHKLRDTFGTRVYAETKGNAKKVQTALNHKSASTTFDYYIAAMDEKEKENTFKDTVIKGLDKEHTLL